MSSAEAATPDDGGAQDVWRALANPARRRILDLLRASPTSTGQLAEHFTELSRFAVMQHLGVLTDAGLVIVERRGRDRINHLNAVPLREWYERWVHPLADSGSADLLALRRASEKKETPMTTDTQALRTVRLAFELRIKASAQRTFDVMTTRSQDWYPHTYGGDRVTAVVLEPQVGGRHYEDWGDGAGYLYGHVTVYDPPSRWATRSRIGPGSILDSDYELSADKGAVVVRVTKVAVGPFTDEEAAAIATYGDIRPAAPAIERLANDGV